MLEYWNSEREKRLKTLGEQASCLFAEYTGRMPVLPVWVRPAFIKSSIIPLFHHSAVPPFRPSIIPPFHYSIIPVVSLYV
jgi:hypothetical protein